MLLHVLQLRRGKFAGFLPRQRIAIALGHRPDGRLIEALPLLLFLLCSGPFVAAAGLLLLLLQCLRQLFLSRQEQVHGFLEQVEIVGGTNRQQLVRGKIFGGEFLELFGDFQQVLIVLRLVGSFRTHQGFDFRRKALEGLFVLRDLIESLHPLLGFVFFSFLDHCAGLVTGFFVIALVRFGSEVLLGFAGRKLLVTLLGLFLPFLRLGVGQTLHIRLQSVERHHLPLVFVHVAVAITSPVEIELAAIGSPLKEPEHLVQRCVIAWHQNLEGYVLGPALLFGLSLNERSRRTAAL